MFIAMFKQLWSKNLTQWNHAIPIQHQRSLSSNASSKILSTISDIKVSPKLQNTSFLKMLRMNFKQNGVKRYWDFMKLHDSLTCVLYNRSRNVLIFVKQFRPPCFVTGALPTAANLSIEGHHVDWNKVPLKLGMTIELCGGIIDAKLSDEEIMKNEVYEECGYDVPLKNFQKIITYVGAVGAHGNRQTLYYVECTDDMDITKRGETAPEGDLIDVVEMSIPEVREFLSRKILEPVGGNVSLGMLWFLANKTPNSGNKAATSNSTPHDKRPTTIHKDIKDISVGPMPASEYLKTLKLEFTQNGRKRYRDIARVHDSVIVVLYNTTRKVLILVRQFRPAVFVCGAIPSSADNSIDSLNKMDWSKVPLELGVMLEVPGGILDEDITPTEAIKQEILEECGYDVPLESIEATAEYRTSTGVTGDRQTVFYAECTDAMRVSKGGGKPENGEFVEVVEMTIPEVRQFLNQKEVAANASILILMMWFLAFKVDNKKR